MENLISYITMGVSALVAFCTSGIALITKIHNKFFKKSDSIFEEMLKAMVTAEQMYAPMKAKGFDVSAMKKQYVLSELQSFSLSKKITFDKAKWEEELEKMITFSNSVNTNETI